MPILTGEFPKKEDCRIVKFERMPIEVDRVDGNIHFRADGCGTGSVAPSGDGMVGTFTCFGARTFEMSVTLELEHRRLAYVLRENGVDAARGTIDDLPP